MGVSAMFGDHPLPPIRSYVEGIGANNFWILPRPPIRSYVEGMGEKTWGGYLEDLGAAGKNVAGGRRFA